MAFPRPAARSGLWHYGTPIRKVGPITMVIADLLQITTALIVLIAVTVLAVTGHVSGSDAVTVYGIVLGYSFGVSQGIRTERESSNGIVRTR